MSEAMFSHDFLEVSVPGDTVLIRQLNLDDAQRYFDLLAADRTHFSQFDDGITDKYKTADDVRESILRARPERYRFGIWDGDTMVGSINIEEHNDTQAEVGYWVGAEHTGNGYAARALKALSTFGFEHLKKEELFAHVLIGNQASRKTLERAGYVLAEEDDGYWVFRMKREHHGD